MQRMEPVRAGRNPAADALLAWFKGEFTAANAIIDALCQHLRAISGPDRRPEYDLVFAAIHRRRMNWIPILQTQRYFPIAEVVVALRDAAARRAEKQEAERRKVVVVAAAEERTDRRKEVAQEPLEKVVEEEAVEARTEGMADESVEKEEEEARSKGIVEDIVEKEVEEVKARSAEMAEEPVEKEQEEERESLELVFRNAVEKEQEKECAAVRVSESGTQRPLDVVTMDVQAEVSAVEHADQAPSDLAVSGFSNNPNALEDVHSFSERDDCNQRPASVRTTKGFTAKESIDGHMVNVVKGLKLYDDIFVDLEISNMLSVANELRVAGQNGELSGETYISFNQQVKGNKREMIQLGVPIFGQKKDKPSNVEPIPAAYEEAINRLVLWRLIPESRKPNCCVINFFDEGECSQPYLKPPHIEQPISTLSLTSGCRMVFGRILMSDRRHENYKGSLELSLNEGSLVVMRGNSASTTHAICPSTNKRTTVTFVKVCTDGSNHSRQVVSSRKPLLTRRMTLWQVSGLQEKDKDLSGKLVASSPRGCRALAGAVPRWGVIHVPVVSVTAGWPLIVRRKSTPTGTGVFIPCNAASKTSPREAKARDNHEGNPSG